MFHVNAMKLHLAHASGINLITAYGDDYVAVNHEARQASLILMPDRLLDWPVTSFASLTHDHLDALAELRPSLVLLGTGSQHRFPHPNLYRALITAGIGLEHMTTAAACRTYNILATEGRQVAAALIIDLA